jgi:hypothetical protein
VAALVGISGCVAQLNVPVPNNGYEDPLLAGAGDSGAPAQWTTDGVAYFPLATEFSDAPEGRNVLRLQQGQSASIGIVRVRKRMACCADAGQSEQKRRLTFVSVHACMHEICPFSLVFVLFAPPRLPMYFSMRA